MTGKVGEDASLIATSGPSRADTSRISHPMRDEVLFVGSRKQMGPGTAGKHGHVIPAVRLQSQRHRAGKLVVRLVHVHLVQIEPSIVVHVAFVARSVGVADGGVR